MQGSGPDRIARATRLVQDGALADARRIVMLTLADHPGLATGLTLAGHIAIRRAAPDDAVRNFERALRAGNSDDPRAMLNLARAQELAGRTPDALATARRAADRFPTDPKVRGFTALLLLESGQPDAAASLLLDGGRPLTIDPETAFKAGLRLARIETYRSLALDLLERAVRAPGRHVESATRAFAIWLDAEDPRTFDAARRALVLQPDACEAMDALDGALRVLKRPLIRAAWAWYSCCLQTEDTTRLAAAAQLTHEVKWPAHGIAANTRLLESRPNDIEVIGRICALYSRDRELSTDKAAVSARALGWGQLIIGPEPADPRIWDAVAGLYKDMEEFGEADALWCRTIAKFPGFEVLHYNRGLFLDEQERLVAAAQSLRMAIVLKPAYQRANNILSLTLSRQHELHAALRSVRRAVVINPKHTACWLNYGSHLRAVGRYSEALVAYEQGEQFGRLAGEKEQEAGACFNRGMTQISLGELEIGFHLLESRWATRGFPSPRRKFKQPIWRGPRRHPNTGLLIYLEQGLGDEVMMSWYIPQLRQDTKRLIVDCDARLIDIFARTYEGVEFVPRSTEGHSSTHDPDIRHKVPILHVPQYYVPEMKFLIRENWDWADRRGARFPARLVVGEDRLQRWDRWFEARYPGRRRVSMSWRSKMRNRTRDQQYITIEDLARSLPDGVVAINLQYSSTAEETERLAELVRDRDIEVVTPEGVDLTNDLDDVFAILQVSDAAVTPMISLAWMAGAVGCPGYIFRTSRERAIWHQFGTPFVPWAPSMRLFFRDPSERWDAVIQDIHARLSRFLESPPERFC